MFNCQQYMTDEQQAIAQQFQISLESEYALCVSEIRKINQAIANNPSQSSDWSGADCANLELHSLQKYWHNRLDCLIDLLNTKDYQLSQQLADKYLKGIKIRVSS